MVTKKYFFPYGSFSTKDGTEIRFWEDKWLGNATLREQYLALYNNVRHTREGVGNFTSKCVIQKTSHWP
jgi:hypothetical protein